MTISAILVKSKINLSVLLSGLLVLLTLCGTLDAGEDTRWELLGPGEGAFIHDIEFAKGAVWVTSDASGIFKSTDDGKSWQPMNNGLCSEGFNVSNSREALFFNRIPMLQLEIDKNAPRNMYAFSNFAFVYSRNGGKYWEKTIINLGKDKLLRGAEKSYRFCLDPDISGKIYLMRLNGDFFISEDFGKTFKKISTLKHERGLWFGLQILDYKNLKLDSLSPAGKRTLYFCCGDGFFISEDGGRKWRKEVKGLPYTEIVGMDTLVKDGKVMIFAAVAGRNLRRTEGRRNCGGIYFTSPERNFVWKQLDVAVNGRPVNFNNNLYGIVVADNKTGRVYTANSIGKGPDILYSSDLGRSWHPIYIKDIKNPGWIYHPEKLANVQKLAVNPRKSDELWLRSWRYGLLKSEDMGKSWENVYSNVKDGKNANRGLHTYWGTSCLPDKTDPDRIYVGLSDFGPCVSNDNGGSWSLIHSPGSINAWLGMKSITDGHLIKDSQDPIFEKLPGSGWSRLNVKPDWRVMEPDAENPECFYVSIGSGTRYIAKNKLHRESALLKTLDRAKSFYFIKPGKETGLPPFTGFSDLLSLPRPKAPFGELWVAAMWKGIYKSSNGGRNFEKLKSFNEDFKLGDYSASKLTLDPNDSNRIYLSCGTSGNKSGGEHTKRDYIYNSRYFADFKFQNNIPDLIDKGELRVAAQGALWMTPNRGKTWRKLTDKFANVRNLQVDPFNSDILYMAVIGHKSTEKTQFMKGGVYKSTDRGTTWKRILDQPIVTDIAVHPTKPNCIFAACTGWPGKVNPGYSFGILLDQDEMKKCKPGVYFSRDGGNSWEDISGNLKNITHTLKRMTLEKWKPDSLFITTSSGILRLNINKQIAED